MYVRADCVIKLKIFASRENHLLFKRSPLGSFNLRPWLGVQRRMHILFLIRTLDRDFIPDGDCALLAYFKRIKHPIYFCPSRQETNFCVPCLEYLTLSLLSRKFFSVINLRSGGLVWNRALTSVFAKIAKSILSRLALCIQYWRFRKL